MYTKVGTTQKACLDTTTFCKDHLGMGSYSNYLFSSPSFLEGSARIVDFGGTLTEFNRSLDEEQADYLAMYNDWLATGDDIIKAIELMEARSRGVEKVGSP